MPEIQPGKKISVDLYYGYENSSSKSKKINVKLGTSEINFKITSDMSETELRELADKYSCITFEEATSEETYDYFEFYNVLDTSHSLIDEDINVKDDSKFKIVYHKTANYEITLSESSDDEGYTILTATSNDTSFDWTPKEQEGFIISISDEKNKFKFKKKPDATSLPDSITITVTNSKGKSASKTITIN